MYNKNKIGGSMSRTENYFEQIINHIRKTDQENIKVNKIKTTLSNYPDVLRHNPNLLLETALQSNNKSLLMALQQLKIDTLLVHMSEELYNMYCNSLLHTFDELSDVIEGIEQNDTNGTILILGTNQELITICVLRKALEYNNEFIVEYITRINSFENLLTPNEKLKILLLKRKANFYYYLIDQGLEEEIPTINNIITNYLELIANGNIDTVVENLSINDERERNILLSYNNSQLLISIIRTNLQIGYSFYKNIPLNWEVINDFRYTDPELYSLFQTFINQQIMEEKKKREHAIKQFQETQRLQHERSKREAEITSRIGTMTRAQARQYQQEPVMCTFCESGFLDSSLLCCGMAVHRNCIEQNIRRHGLSRCPWCNSTWNPVRFGSLDFARQYTNFGGNMTKIYNKYYKLSSNLEMK